MTENERRKQVKMSNAISGARVELTTILRCTENKLIIERIKPIIKFLDETDPFNYDEWEVLSDIGEQIDALRNLKIQMSCGGDELLSDNFEKAIDTELKRLIKLYTK